MYPDSGYKLAHAQSVCTRPFSPRWEGPGDEASLALYIARIVTRGCPARDCSSVTNLKFGRNTVLSSLSL